MNEENRTYCDECKAWCEHTTATHRAWQLTKRPRKPISRPVIQNRDPESSTR